MGRAVGGWSYSGLYPPPELLGDSTATAQIGLVEVTRGRGRGWVVVRVFEFAWVGLSS